LRIQQECLQAFTWWILSISRKFFPSDLKIGSHNKVEDGGNVQCVAFHFKVLKGLQEGKVRDWIHLTHTTIVLSIIKENWWMHEYFRRFQGLLNVLSGRFSSSRCQFHQHFYVQIFRMNVFSAAFTTYMQQEKAAETAFVRKIRTFNVDEIDTLYLSYFDREKIISSKMNGVGKNNFNLKIFCCCSSSSSCCCCLLFSSLWRWPISSFDFLSLSRNCRASKDYHERRFDFLTTSRSTLTCWRSSGLSRLKFDPKIRKHSIDYSWRL